MGLFAHCKRLELSLEQVSPSRNIGPDASPNWEESGNTAVPGHWRAVNYSPEKIVNTNNWYWTYTRGGGSKYYNTHSPLNGSPSWVQTVWASSSVKPLLHTVPQARFKHTSTLPSRRVSPPTTLTSPSWHLTSLIAEGGAHTTPTSPSDDEQLPMMVSPQSVSLLSVPLQETLDWIPVRVLSE